VNMEVQTMFDGLELPAGVEASLGGAAEQQQESFAGILTAMAIAVALVYLSMVITFGSLLTPFVILLTLPLAAIGAFPALAITGRELGLPSMLGLLMLIGIVVTNAIVMLEFVERLKREDGLNTMEALKQGAETRLRPILMTAIVTILALTPLALGLSDGALLSASLATVVIGGLFSSTLLTLFVIPAVYSLFDGLSAASAVRTPASTRSSPDDRPRPFRPAPSEFDTLASVTVRWRLRCPVSLKFWPGLRHGVQYSYMVRPRSCRTRLPPGRTGSAPGRHRRLTRRRT